MELASRLRFSPVRFLIACFVALCWALCCIACFALCWAFFLYDDGLGFLSLFKESGLDSFDFASYGVVRAAFFWFVFSSDFASWVRPEVEIGFRPYRLDIEKLASK